MDQQFDGSLALLLWRAEHVLRSHIETSTAVTRLTLPQLVALAELASQPGLSAAELARRMPITPQAVSTLVTRLEAYGYVTRCPSVVRNQPLELSDTGRAALEQALALFSDVEDRFFSPLDEEQRRRLHLEIQSCLPPGKPGLDR